MKKIVVAFIIVMCMLSSAMAGDTLYDTLEVSKDTYINAYFPTQNYGQDPTLTIWNEAGEPKIVTFLEFEWPFPTAYALDSPDPKLDEFLLGLFCKHSEGGGEVKVNPVSPGWEENNTTWNNAPSVFYDFFFKGFDFASQSGWTFIDMWEGGDWCMAHEYFGFMLSGETPNKSWDFRSKEDPGAYTSPQNTGPKLFLKYHYEETVEEALPDFEIQVPPISQGSIHVNFSLPSANHATLKIYDASGSLVQVLEVSSGSQTIAWHGDPGVYFVRFETAGEAFVKKTVITN
ncbi:T9SS type A sorting domain-containing protein [candidate division WOR-3 bacterium]|nr:T9SS type A sorting domain-containing protein [candidate division WOR-3 bacterium]